MPVLRAHTHMLRDLMRARAQDWPKKTLLSLLSLLVQRLESPWSLLFWAEPSFLGWVRRWDNQDARGRWWVSRRVVGQFDPRSTAVDP